MRMNKTRSKSSLVHYLYSLLSSKEKLLFTNAHSTDCHRVILPCDRFCCTKELWWENKLARWISRFLNSILVVIKLPSVLDGSRLGWKGVLFLVIMEKTLSSAAFEWGIVRGNLASCLRVRCCPVRVKILFVTQKNELKEEVCFNFLLSIQY